MFVEDSDGLFVDELAAHVLVYSFPSNETVSMASACSGSKLTKKSQILPEIPESQTASKDSATNAPPSIPPAT
jgi:hypothetical protein